MSGVQDIERARMLHFSSLAYDQQLQAIQRLAIAGMTDQTIASATGLSVEMIRRVLAEHRTALER